MNLIAQRNSLKRMRNLFINPWGQRAKIEHIILNYFKIKMCFLGFWETLLNKSLGSRLDKESVTYLYIYCCYRCIEPWKNRLYILKSTSEIYTGLESLSANKLNIFTVFIWFFALFPNKKKSTTVPAFWTSLRQSVNLSHCGTTTNRRWGKFGGGVSRCKKEEGEASRVIGGWR